MTAPYLPHSAPSRKSPADVWEDLVARGMSPDAATAAVAQQFKMPAPKTRGFGQGALDVGNELLQGASFGWADEAAGLVSPELGDAMRQRSEDLHKANPTAALAANVLGGLATGGGIAKLGMKAFPRLAGSGLKAAALRGAANVGEGAVTGAIGGAGAGTTPEGKLSGALAGGLIGGVTGGAIPGAAALAKGARRAILPYSQRGASKVADEMIGQAIEDAGRIDLPVDGKPLQLVDRLGQPGRKLARGARTTSAAARQTLADMSAQRMPGTAQRVMGDVHDALGVGGQTVRQLAKGLDDQRAAIGAAEFTPERMAAPVTSETLQGTLLSSPIFRKAHQAFRSARKLEPDAAVPAPLFDRTGLTRDPTLQDVEDIRQGLEDILSSGGYEVRTKTGGPQIKNLSKASKRAVQKAKRALLDDRGLNAEHPWYGPAREALAGKHAEGRALMGGEKMATATPADVADALGALGSGNEQQMMRAGLANRIARKVNESPAIAASRVAGGGPTIPGRMERLTAASASPDAAATLRARLADLAADSSSTDSASDADADATADAATAAPAAVVTARSARKNRARMRPPRNGTSGPAQRYAAPIKSRFKDVVSKTPRRDAKLSSSSSDWIFTCRPGAAPCKYLRRPAPLRA